MQLGVLGAVDSWYLRDLQRAAKPDELVQPLPFSRLAARVSSRRGEVWSHERNCSSYTGILVRSMPPGSLEQVVFRMDLLQQFVLNGVPVLNSPKAIETAVDKHLALLRLKREGLEVPHTIVCQSWEEGMDAFEELGRDVVLKPLFGSEGRGITRISDADIAYRTFRMLTQLGAVLYLQEFVPHQGFDLRLLVIHQEVWGIRRRHPDDWRTNISRGAIAEPLEVTSELAHLAFQASHAVEAVMAGVDLLPSRDGRLLALEVNAVPGWRALAKSLDVDIARKVLDLFR